MDELEVIPRPKALYDGNVSLHDGDRDFTYHWQIDIKRTN